MREMELQVSVSDALPRPRLAVEFNSWVIKDYGVFFRYFKLEIDLENSF